MTIQTDFKPLYQIPRTQLTHVTALPIQNANKKLAAHLAKAKRGLDSEISIFVKGYIILTNGNEKELQDWILISFYKDQFETVDLNHQRWVKVDFSTTKNLKTFYMLGIPD